LPDVLVVKAIVGILASANVPATISAVCKPGILAESNIPLLMSDVESAGSLAESNVPEVISMLLN